jgi:hypothetical protein
MSTDRILTTHTGSLPPQSAELVAASPDRRKRSAPTCTAPIGVQDTEAATFRWERSDGAMPIL